MGTEYIACVTRVHPWQSLTYSDTLTYPDMPSTTYLVVKTIPQSYHSGYLSPALTPRYQAWVDHLNAVIETAPLAARLDVPLLRRADSEPAIPPHRSAINQQQQLVAGRAAAAGGGAASKGQQNAGPPTGAGGKAAGGAVAGGGALAAGGVPGVAGYGGIVVGGGGKNVHQVRPLVFRV